MQDTEKNGRYFCIFKSWFYRFRYILPTDARHNWQVSDIRDENVQTFCSQCQCLTSNAIFVQDGDMRLAQLLSTHRYGRQGPKGIVWHGKGLEKLHLSTLNIIRFSWFSASGLTLVNEYSLHIVNSFNLKIVFILCCHCDCHINVMLQGSDISRVWSTVVAA